MYCMYVFVCLSVCLIMNIYIYTEIDKQTETERQRDSQPARQRDRHTDWLSIWLSDRQTRLSAGNLDGKVMDPGGPDGESKREVANPAGISHRKWAIQGSQVYGFNYSWHHDVVGYRKPSYVYIYVYLLQRLGSSSWQTKTRSAKKKEVVHCPESAVTRLWNPLVASQKCRHIKCYPSWGV